MEFEIGDLVSSDDPGDIGIIIATSADYVKVRWIRLTKERGDFLNGPYWILDCFVERAGKNEV